MNSYKQRIYTQSIDTLIDVMSSIIEHEEELEITIILNFIDHYRAYMQDYIDKAKWDIPLIEFEVFINDQSLLDAASLLISLETGEGVAAPLSF